MPKGGKRRALKLTPDASQEPPLKAQVVVKIRYSTDFKDYEAVARLIDENPPAWLGQYLMHWSQSVFVDHMVQRKQPTRSQMVKRLRVISDAARLLRQELSQAPIQEFLDAVGDRPMDWPMKFDLVIGEIQNRADRAAKLPSLVNKAGKPKSGRGPALPDGAISPQAYCALLIAEAWNFLRGRFPPFRNTNTAAAADLLWQLSGGTKSGWGDNPLNAWPYHFGQAAKAEAVKLRTEIRRHLATSKQFG